jgi:hypothetical protein
MSVVMENYLTAAAVVTFVVGAAVLYSRSKTSQKSTLASVDDDDDGDESVSSTPTPAATAFTSLNKVAAQPMSLPAHKTACESKLRAVYNGKSTNVTIDLPRLAKRVEIYENGKLISDAESMDAMRAVSHVVKLLAAHFESRDKIAAIDRVCDSVAAASDQGEPSALVKSVLDVVGECATSRVLRTVNQAIVMPASFATKAHTRLLTKDVKTKDGWRITIHLEGGGSVKVTHIRREESFGSAAFEHFVLQFTTELYLRPQDAADAAATLTGVAIKLDAIVADRECSVSVRRLL